MKRGRRWNGSIAFTWVPFAVLTVLTGCGGETGDRSILDGSRDDMLGPKQADVGAPSDVATSDAEDGNRDSNERDKPPLHTDLAPSHDTAIADVSRDQALALDVRNNDAAIDMPQTDVPFLDSALDLAVEAGEKDLPPNPDAASAAEICKSTLGTVITALCCTSVTDFPNQCTTGACGCAPAYSHNVSSCNCPSGCFMPGLGCVGPGSVCTVGANQTCNDNPIISSLRGRCVEGGRCVCLMGAGLNPITGRCQ